MTDLRHERCGRGSAPRATRTEAACLVTGERGPIARLHPAIKGVWGAQTSGASIVSFNLDAFTSYGHEQGDNAPVSEAAAFAYTTALNRFLERGSGHRIQIGDASDGLLGGCVRRARRPRRRKASSPALLGADGVDESVQAKKVGAILQAIREGRPIADFSPDLPQGVRFFVLGLAPNAARLSVRFYLEDDFGAIAARLSRACRATCASSRRQGRTAVASGGCSSKRRRSANRRMCRPISPASGCGRSSPAPPTR